MFTGLKRVSEIVILNRKNRTRLKNTTKRFWRKLVNNPG